MTRWIDLNADLGEGCGDDAAIMRVVTSCNIACGGHAGDAASMTEALKLAKAHGVSAGAHPSYPDRENFGRENIDISETELRASLEEQVNALKRLASEIGISLTHLKPHGALYNFAARDEATAKLIAEVTRDCLPGTALSGPPNSELQFAADEYGLAFIAEGFVDRAYENDGSLRQRSLPGAVISEASQCARQALQIATESAVTSHEGSAVPLPVQTLCVHSDTPSAVAAAQRVRSELEAAGIAVRAPE